MEGEAQDVDVGELKDSTTRSLEVSRTSRLKAGLRPHSSKCVQVRCHYDCKVQGLGSKGLSLN